MFHHIKLFVMSLFNRIFGKKASTTHTVSHSTVSFDFTAVERAQQKRNRRKERNLRWAAAGGVKVAGE